MSILGDKTPIVVSVEMGYGHLRAALPLAQAFGTELMYADRDPLADAEERRLWAWVQRGHELLSRPPSLAALFGRGRWMERITAIPPLYSSEKLSEPNWGAKVLALLAERGLGRGLVRHLERTGAPLVTTFYVPAMIADRAGHSRVYCVVTDADVNRVWAPLFDRPSSVHYFAPSLRVVRRLQTYGVPRDRITMTGFPLPLGLLGGAEFGALHRSLARRLVRLDPAGLFRELYRHDLERVLGPLPKGEEGQPPHLMFAVGGAGAQAEMAFDFLPSLKAPIESGRLRLTLVAGMRPDVAATFERALAATRLTSHVGHSIRILRASDFDTYYRGFNAALTEADILWTKPSELSFYAGLGVPLVLAKPVGSHERFNRRWLREQGVALKQDDVRHAWHWLEEWIKDGTLAASAWMGYVRLPKDGTHRITSEVQRLAYGARVGASERGSEAEARSVTRHRAAFAIPIVVALLLFVVRDANWSETAALVAHVGTLSFAALTLPAFAALCLETYGWRTALASLGHRVAFPNLLRVRLSAEALAQTLPLGAVWCESIKPMLLARHCGLPASASVGAMVARKYLLLASQAAFLTLVFSVSVPTLRAASGVMLGHSGLEWLPLGCAGAVAIGAVALRVTFCRGAIAERLFGFLARLPVPTLRRRLGETRSAFVDSDRQIARFFTLGLAAHVRSARYVLLAWFTESLETYLFLRALGADVSLPTAMAIESLAVLLRHVFVLLPAGIGVQDIGYVALMSATGVGGASLALAFAVLKRTKELFWCAVGYALLLSDRKATRPRSSKIAAALGSI